MSTGSHHETQTPQLKRLKLYHWFDNVGKIAIPFDKGLFIFRITAKNKADQEQREEKEPLIVNFNLASLFHTHCLATQVVSDTYSFGHRAAEFLAQQITDYIRSCFSFRLLNHARDRAECFCCGLYLRPDRFNFQRPRLIFVADIEVDDGKYVVDVHGNGNNEIPPVQFDRLPNMIGGSNHHNDDQVEEQQEAQQEQEQAPNQTNQYIPEDSSSTAFFLVRQLPERQFDMLRALLNNNAFSNGNNVNVPHPIPSFRELQNERLMHVDSPSISNEDEDATDCLKPDGDNDEEFKGVLDILQSWYTDEFHYPASFKLFEPRPVMRAEGRSPAKRINLDPNADQPEGRSPAKRIKLDSDAAQPDNNSQPSLEHTNLLKIKPPLEIIKQGKESKGCEPMCSICLEKMSTEEEVIKIVRCSHVFHRNCIFNWLPDKHSCPYCRSRSLANVYL